MMKHIEADSRQLLNAFSVGQMSHDNEKPAESATGEELEIKVILTPDQLSAYPDYKQAELMIAAESTTKAELANMNRVINLSEEQQNKIYEVKWTPKFRPPLKLDFSRSARCEKEQIDETKTQTV